MSMTPRPTVYKGVHMRSRLEAFFAQWLDVVHIPWQHEPKAFGDETGQYLPDFKLGAASYQQFPWQDEFQRFDATVYAEVKPAAASTDAANTLRRMEIIWSSEPDSLLMLATPHDSGYWVFPLGGDLWNNTPRARWGWGCWVARSTDAAGEPTAADIMPIPEIEFEHWDDRPWFDGPDLCSPWASDAYRRHTGLSQPRD